VKRLIPVLFIVLLLSLAACASGGGGVDLLSDIEERGIVRVSTDANYEPQSFLDENGEFIGFDIDVAREIASRSSS